MTSVSIGRNPTTFLVAAALLWAGAARAEPLLEVVALPGIEGIRHALNAEGTTLGLAPLAGSNGRGSVLIHRDGRVRPLELLGNGAIPAALNDAGDVAVDVQPGGPCQTLPAEIVCPRRASIWRSNAASPKAPGPTVHELRTLGGPRSFARAINKTRSVVGWSDLDRPTGAAHGAAFVQRAFLFADGRLTELPGLGGENSRALAMNDAGEIAGWAEDAKGHRHAVVWRDGAVRDLGTLGGTESEAQAISARSHVAGWSRDAAGRRRGFLWRGSGGLIDLGTLGGAESEATIVSGRENIVGGWAETATGERRAFFWWDGNRIDFNSLVMPGFAKPGEPNLFSEVVAINDRMDVVATLSAASATDKSQRVTRHVLLVRRGTRP